MYRFIIIWFLLFSSTTYAEEVVRVIDGDTIKLGETTIRLFGIDAPESGQSCATRAGRSWPCGNDATSFLQSLVTGKAVTCDDRGTDGYGRTIGVCMAGGVNLNEQMVINGSAWAFRRYSVDYAPLEDSVRETGIGIWQAETQTPWDYRSAKWEVAAQVAPDGCPIKGNISRNGRIYHPPWSPWYSRTKISIERGERWFCSEAEAIAAGWRAPQWGN